MKKVLIVAILMGLLGMIPVAALAQAGAPGLVGGHHEGDLPDEGTVTVTSLGGQLLGTGIIDTDSGLFSFNISVPSQFKKVHINATFANGEVGVDQLTGNSCDLDVTGAGVLLCQKASVLPTIQRFNVNFEIGNAAGPPPSTCDREIEKTVTPHHVQSGQQVTITLTVTNVGKADCPVVDGINVADPQPTGLTFVGPVLANNPAWSCGFSGPGVIAFCTATSPLLPGPQNAVTITFEATVTAPPGSTIQNCAEVTNVGDAVQTNNTSCVIIQV